MDGGTLLRETRLERQLDQTLRRLLDAMSVDLRLTVEAPPSGNQSLRDLRSDLRELTAEERVEQAMELSEFLTDVAASAAEGKPAVRVSRGEGSAASSGGATHPLRPRELLAALQRHDVDFVVIGGFALAPHGYVRATKDVDIVPDPDPLNLARLARALRDLEAEPDLGELDSEELGIAPDEDGLRLGWNWVLTTRFGRLDVMQEVPGLRDYHHLRAGAIRVSDVLYAGYDELIRMKAASGRDEDLRDIGALEAARREH